MKTRRAWRYLIAHKGTPTGWGTCPLWAYQPATEGTTVTRERVLVVGPLVPCNYPGCDGTHALVSAP